jgi:uncharacterized protein involved in type VI secretion and phage assembly
VTRQRGVVIGIVRERDDEDGQGRGKVDYPWLPGRPRSPWTPIAAPLAGGSRGACFMPEIDDEVLVAFEQGQFEHPYIVGFLWNGVDRPPITDPAHRVIVTPGGNELRFDDTEDDQRVTLSTAAGQRLELVDDGGVVVLRTFGDHRLELSDDGGKVVLRTSGGLSVTLDDGGPKIELSGGGRKVTMSGGQVQIT